MRGDRVRESHLIDHADIERRIHTRHSEIEEVDGRLALVLRGVVGQLGHVPLVVVVRRQDHSALRAVLVDPLDHGAHTRVVEVVGSGDRVLVAHVGDVEPTLVDDATASDVDARVGQHLLVAHDRPHERRDPQCCHHGRATELHHDAPALVPVLRSVDAASECRADVGEGGQRERYDHDREQDREHGGQQHTAVHEVATLT